MEDITQIGMSSEPIKKKTKLYVAIKQIINFINNSLDLDIRIKYTFKFVIIYIGQPNINYAFCETFFEKHNYDKIQLQFCKIIIPHEHLDCVKMFNNNEEMLEQIKYFNCQYVKKYISDTINYYKVKCPDFMELNSNQIEILEKAVINDYESATKYYHLMIELSTKLYNYSHNNIM